jgi:2-desacetyl-2-hydroxyethyl bacteriochlorophyllide A dehydrogenase
MKAGVMGQAQKISLKEVPYPALNRHGIIVKVKACGICGSDVHFYQRGGPGTIMGHEFAGDVVETGSEVQDIEVGDRVVAMGGKGCGECYWCKQGDYIRCSKLGFVGYAMPGAFAEFVAVPSVKLGQYVAKLPAALTYEEGAAAEPLAVALYAVQQAQPKPDDVVVVLGLGIIGLCIVQILKSLGVKKIYASGHRKKRIDLAIQSGAIVAVDASKEDISPIVTEQSTGRGADIVFDVAGFESTFHQALRMTHRGGKIELVGLYSKSFEWNPSILVSNDISLFGCGLKWDLPGAVKLMETGKVDVKPLITHKFSLDRVKEAFDIQIMSTDAVKVLIIP